jgi:signal transduction histidine kinase
MQSARNQATKAFAWQALLILLPVAVLAALGVYSLRQDRLLAQHEAAERAQSLAEDLLPKVWAGLTNRDSGWLGPIGFRVSPEGALVSPVPWSPPLVPKPLDLQALSEDQHRLWASACTLENQDPVSPVVVQAFRDFLQTNPDSGFAALAHYRLAVLLAKKGEWDEAIETLLVLLSRYPAAQTESGLPMAPLAKVKLLELAGKVAGAGAQPPREGAKGLATLGDFCGELLQNPNVLTPYLLDRIAQWAESPERRREAEEALRSWRQDEFSRGLYDRASREFSSISTSAAAPFDLTSKAGLAGGLDPLPHLFWINSRLNPPPSSKDIPVAMEPWLVAGFNEGPRGRWYRCQSEPRLRSALDSLVEASRQIPEYMGVRVDVAGRKLAASDLHVWREADYMTKGGGGWRKANLDQESTNLLASASLNAGGPGGVKVSVYLTSPDNLFHHQRTRTFWFGSVIAASALAALVGLFAAYRAFQRQLRLSEMKSNFVSSVSHELRAPIASVRLMAESLERGKIIEPARRQEYFQLISRECRRLSSLIENVLDFSRIDQGRKQYELEPTDLRALVENTRTVMEPYAAERGIALKLVMPSHSDARFEACVDGKAIQQALINLVDNALKHSPAKSEVTLGLEAARVNENSTQALGCAAPPRPQVVLWVEDHGEGIPPEEHEKIFEQFYRCGSELRRRTEGVGIGLSLVKHIVEGHGGRVSVRSAVGQGSRFRIQLSALNSHPDLSAGGNETETSLKGSK